MSKSSKRMIQTSPLLCVSRYSGKTMTRAPDKLLIIPALALVLFLYVGNAHGFSDFTNITQIFDNVPGGVWSDFSSLLDAHRGQTNCTNLPELKKYLQQFGYQDFGPELTDEFDNATETAIKLYQANFGLNITGMLDGATLKQMMKPRCGREDVLDGISVMGGSNSSSSRFRRNRNTTGLHLVQHYSFFPSNPKWESRDVLTYSIASSAPSATGISSADLSTVFASAFRQWAEVVPMNFTETTDYSNADIKIVFASGDHGDGKAFDGVLGVLAHAFSPEDGRLHFDASEEWTLDVESAKSTNAVDLKSVAVHEIGHILGLAHSSEDTAVMYPNIGAKEVKTELAQDDVQGAQALYGANPNYTGQSETRSQTENGIPSSSHLTRACSMSIPLIGLVLALF